MTLLCGKPKFTLVKTSDNDTVHVGDMVSFTINYTNTGSINLTGVYIKDNEYTNGLVFSDYSDKDLWTFDGTDTWYYNSELAPGESAILELTFQATTAGEKNNTATAGHNVTDETLNSTDTVLVVEDEPDTPEEDLKRNLKRNRKRNLPLLLLKRQFLLFLLQVILCLF